MKSAKPAPRPKGVIQQSLHAIRKAVIAEMETEHKALESFTASMPYDAALADRLEFYPRYVSHLMGMHHESVNQAEMAERIQQELKFIQWKGDEYAKWAANYPTAGLKPNTLSEEYLKLFIQAVHAGWIDDKEQVIKHIILAGKQRQKAEFFALAKILMEKYHATKEDMEKAVG